MTTESNPGRIAPRHGVARPRAAANSFGRGGASPRCGRRRRATGAKRRRPAVPKSAPFINTPGHGGRTRPALQPMMGRRGEPGPHRVVLFFLVFAGPDRRRWPTQQVPSRDFPPRPGRAGCARNIKIRLGGPVGAGLRHVVQDDGPNHTNLDANSASIREAVRGKLGSLLSLN